MALDTALLLPCPFCRELPDESPLADVTRAVLFGVERVEGAATAVLPALVAAATGLAYAPPPSATLTTALVVASAATASVEAEYTSAAVEPQAATAEVAAQLATASVIAEAATAEVTVAYVSVAGDTLPVLTAALSAGGSPINLAGASVVCNLRIGSTRLSKTATITNASGGVVTVTFAATDLVAGRGEAQFVVTFGDGSIRTVPNSGDNVVVAIAERL